MSALRNAIALIGELVPSPEMERKELGLLQSLVDIRWVMDSFRHARRGCVYRSPRAGTRRGRWSERGRADQTHDFLAPLCDWFIVGLGTPELKNAKVLIDELS